MIIWLFLNLAIANTMLEASLGIIGRDTVPIPGAKEAYTCSSSEQWSDCAVLWKKRADLFDQRRNDALIWTIVSHIRAEELAEAYNVLGELILVAEEVGWPLLIVESWLLQELGGHREAISLLKEYPVQGSDYIGVQMLKMRSYQSLKRYRRAQKTKEAVLQSGRADAWFWQELAKSSPISEKSIFLERAIHSPFSSAHQYIQLVNFYEEQEDFQMALRYGLEGMNIFPEQHQLTYRMLHFSSSEIGRDILEQKVADIQEHSKAQALLGLVLLSEEKYERAIEHLSLAIQYGEKQLLLYEALHKACIRIGAKDKAWQILGEAVTEYPNNEELWEYFYQVSESEEQKRNFFHELNSSWKGGAQHSENMIRRAFRFARSIQDNEMALLWAERELSVSGVSWRSLSKNALVLSELNRREEAISLYERALQIDPENSFVLNNLAWLLINPEDGVPVESQRALVLIQKAIANSPKPVAGYYDTLAAVLWTMGRGTEAIKAQGKAVELAPLEDGYQDRYRKYEISAQ